MSNTFLNFLSKRADTRPYYRINDCAQMSKTKIAVKYFVLNGRVSLETAVTMINILWKYKFNI